MTTSVHADFRHLTRSALPVCSQNRESCMIDELCRRLCADRPEGVA